MLGIAKVKAPVSKPLQMCLLLAFISIPTLAGVLYACFIAMHDLVNAERK